MDKSDYFNKFLNILIRNQKIVVILLLIINISLISFSAYDESVNWDEVCYLGMGKYIFETGNFKTDGSISHAPFSYYINSLFLYPLEIPNEIISKQSCWDRGPEILFRSKNPIRLLFLIRFPLILLSALLGLYVFKWSKKLYGVKAALFALFVYSFSPNIISTAMVALTDFSVVCFSFISMYYFWEFCKKSTAWNLIIVGIFTGIALISKITALFLIPIYIILGLIYMKRIFSERIINLLLIFLIAFFIIFISYGARFDTISNSIPDHYTDRAYQEIRSKINNDNAKDFVFFVIEKIPIPAPTYFIVIGDVVFHSSRGLNGYLFGEIYEPSNKPFSYFFWVLLLKTPIPTMIFLILSLILFKNIERKKFINEFFLIFPMFFFFVPFIFNNVSYDLRHILTIFPFIFVFLSKVINIPLKNKIFFRSIIIILCVWYVISSIMVYPHYISYFNEFVPSGEGYNYLLGTNIDAGQDLIRLNKYLKQHKIDKINFSFHGGIDPSYYEIDYDYMPTVCFTPANKYYKPRAKNCQEDFIEDCAKRKGMIAISVTNLKGRFLKNINCFNWLKEYEPIAKIGNSIFVYNITK